MNLPVILIITILVIYFGWKLMGTGHKKKKPEQKRFSIRKHREREFNDEEDDE